jgi:hypothetical protein
MDEQRMLEQIKEFFRSILAPQIESVRGDIRAAEAKTEAVDTKVDAYRREILAEFRRLEEKVDVRLGAMNEKLDTRLAAIELKLDSRLDAMDQKLAMMDQRLAMMDQKLDLFRKELLAEIRAAIR